MYVSLFTLPIASIQLTQLTQPLVMTSRHGAAPPVDDAGHNRRPVPAASFAPSNPMWGWVGAAAVAVGGGLLMRSLLRGTAPSSSSSYAAFKSQSAHRAAGHAHHYGTATAHSSASHAAGHANHSHVHNFHQPHQAHYYKRKPESGHEQKPNSEQQQQQQQQQEQDEKAQDDADARTSHERWAKVKSDYARFDAFLEAEREHYASRAQAERQAAAGASEFAPFRSYDPAFELGKEQARADYVQSKFTHLKRSKRILKYTSWSGSRTRRNDHDEFSDEEQPLEGGGDRRDEHHSAYRAVQRQMNTQPKFVAARRLLFDPPSAASAASAEGAAGSPPLVHPLPANTPPLTVDAVRSAYFARAKQCHPDVAGGNKEQFQRLTDAYEILITTLEDMERSQKRRAASANRAHKAH